MKTNSGSGGATPERPTLKSIAYITGLGVTTVSRALNDAPDISAKTKERVRLVARQIGYRPNRAGVRLRTGKTQVISMILPAETSGLGLSSLMVFGISQQLASSPYHLIVTPYDPIGDPMDPVRYIVETGSADGVILSRIQPQDPRVAYLHEKGLAYVTHGRTEMGLVHPFVDYQNESFARVAVDEMAARGRTRLALLSPPAELSFATHLRTGFEAGVSAAGIEAVAISEVTSDSPESEIATAIQELMSRAERPDGMVCGSAAAAIVAIGAAEKAGLQIGRDFDLAVKESFNLMHIFRPEVIAFREDFRLAGRLLADAVLRSIEGEAPENLQTLIPPERE